MAFTATAKIAHAAIDIDVTFDRFRVSLGFEFEQAPGETIHPPAAILRPGIATDVRGLILQQARAGSGKCEVIERRFCHQRIAVFADESGVGVARQKRGMLHQLREEFKIGFHA